MKTQIMGAAADLPKSVKILNRVLTWSNQGIWMEADPRHVQEVITALGLKGPTWWQRRSPRSEERR